MLVNPQDGVLDLVGIDAGFVDADVDGQPFAPRFFPQAQHKFALMHGFDESDCLVAGAGDVVACFGKEESLESKVSVVSRGQDEERWAGNGRD